MQKGDYEFCKNQGNMKNSHQKMQDRLATVHQEYDQTLL